MQCFIFVAVEVLVAVVLLHSKLLHACNCSHVVKSLFCLIQAVGQSPETLFGRVEERLLDVGPMLLEKQGRKYAKFMEERQADAA